MFLWPGHPDGLESAPHTTTPQGLCAGVFQLQHHGGHLLSTLARDDFTPLTPWRCMLGCAAGLSLS